MHGGIAILCGNFGITAVNSIVESVMIYQAAQEPVSEMAAQGLIARVKVTMGILINSPAMEASSRVTRNSPTGVMISFDKQDRKIGHKVVAYSRFGV